MRIRALVMRRAKRPTACSAAELLAAHSTVDLERERDAGWTEEVLRHHGQRFVRGEMRRRPWATRCSRRLRARLPNGRADIGKCVTFSIRWSEIHWSRRCESRAGHEAGHATVPLRKTNPTKSASPLLAPVNVTPVTQRTTAHTLAVIYRLPRQPAIAPKCHAKGQFATHNSTHGVPGAGAEHAWNESAPWYSVAKRVIVSRDQITLDRAQCSNHRATIAAGASCVSRARERAGRAAGSRESSRPNRSTIRCGKHKSFNHCC